MTRHREWLHRRMVRTVVRRPPSRALLRARRSWGLVVTAPTRRMLVMPRRIRLLRSNTNPTPGTSVRSSQPLSRAGTVNATVG